MWVIALPQEWGQVGDGPVDVAVRDEAREDLGEREWVREVVCDGKSQCKLRRGGMEEDVRRAMKLRVRSGT